jgi:uncharacterized integral membrane protein (TIGR00698 family)
MTVSAVTASDPVSSADGWLQKLPGLALVAAIATIGTLTQRMTGIAALSPLIVALVIGIGYRRFFGRAQVFDAGVAFALRPILRFAIVLLGLQITLMEVAVLGWRGVFAVALTLVTTFFFTKSVARLFGVERRLAELIAAGTSVCGASAIVACNTVTRGSDEDVAYAMACVTLFGTVAMLTFPLLAGPLHLSASGYGMWAGTSIHEVGQVVGASFAVGEEAGHTAAVAKLTRVMLLAPLILTLGFLRQRGDGSTVQVPTPWFVFGFIGMMFLNTFFTLPEPLLDFLVLLTAFLLTAALAAMGLETDLKKLRQKGVAPLALGALATAFISVTGLVLTLWAAR